MLRLWKSLLFPRKPFPSDWAVRWCLMEWFSHLRTLFRFPITKMYTIWQNAGNTIFPKCHSIQLFFFSPIFFDHVLLKLELGRSAPGPVQPIVVKLKGRGGAFSVKLITDGKKVHILGSRASQRKINIHKAHQNNCVPVDLLPWSLCGMQHF